MMRLSLCYPCRTCYSPQARFNIFRLGLFLFFFFLECLRCFLGFLKPRFEAFYLFLVDVNLLDNKMFEIKTYQRTGPLTHKYSFICYSSLAFGGENGQVKQFFVFLIIVFLAVPTVCTLANIGIVKTTDFTTKGFSAETKEPLSMVGQNDALGILTAQQVQSMDNTPNPLTSLLGDNSSPLKEKSSSSFGNDAEGAEATSIGHMQKGSVDVSVAFSIRNSVQLDSFIADSQKQVIGQQSVLSEEQFEADYSPTQADYYNVISLLTANNLSITQTWPNRLLLTAQGSVDNVERAFNTEIDLFAYQNTTFYKSSSDIVVPAWLSSYSVERIDVNNFPVEPCMSRVSGITPNAIAYNRSPSDFRDVYGTSSAIQSGWTGAGNTIGIVDAYGDPTIVTDVNSFNTYFSLPSLTLTVSGTGGTPKSGWDIETALDVEWAHAMAPGATILLQLSQDNSYGNLFGAVNSLITLANPPNVISLSWGGSETSFYSYIFTAAVAKGIKVYVSTGDNGAYNGGSILAVEYPASDPNVIAVGGTSLYYNTVQGTNQYYEYGWTGSGGGYSSVFSEPSYQSSAGISGSERQESPSRCFS